MARLTVRKSTHGGKRKGAGRPKTATPRKQIAVSRDHADRLAVHADREGIPTLREAAEQAIDAFTALTAARRH